MLADFSRGRRRRMTAGVHEQFSAERAGFEPARAGARLKEENLQAPLGHFGNLSMC